MLGYIKEKVLELYKIPYPPDITIFGIQNLREAVESVKRVIARPN